MRYFVEQNQRDLWSIMRNDQKRIVTIHMTRNLMEAQRMADELNKADKLAFYQGLIIGSSQRSKRDLIKPNESA